MRSYCRCRLRCRTQRELVKEIISQGGSAEALTADVSSAEDVKRVVDRAMARWHRVNILFNNAGIVAGGKVHTLTEEEWDRSFAVNVRSMFLFSRAIVPFFCGKGAGLF